MSLRRRMGLLFAAACAAVLVIGLLATLLIVRVADARSDLIKRAQPAALASAQLLASLADQETGVRGFALTHNETFLAPYESGYASQRTLMARLDHLLAGDRPMTIQLAVVAQQIEAWRDQYALPALAAVRSRSGDFDSQAALDRSKARFDGIRAALGRLDVQIDHDRVEAAHRLDSSNRDLVVLLATSLVLIVGVGLVTELALRRQVIKPIELLATDVRLVVADDLTHEVARVGSSEVERLADDIEAMRRRLVDELGRVAEARSQLTASNEELARSNVDLEQFAYVASHDLQEPLRKIVSFTQLLQQRYAGQLDDRADGYIEFAVDGARRMQLLINDLLEFSRVGRSDRQFVDVDLAACLHGAERNLASEIEAAHAQINAAPLPHVRGDQTLLTAVFQNLIGNALKFRSDAPPEVTVTAEQADGLWWLSVTDNGIGIEPRFANRVFVIFQRLHGRAEYEGTGIGLALAKKVVEFHGGHLWLDTDHHPGARLCFTLPADDLRERA